MACACKVNQEIDRIQKYYSFNKKERNTRQNTPFNKKDAIVTIFIYILLLPLIPLIFIWLLIFSIFSKTKRISIGKFLRFIHYRRDGKK